MKPPAIQSASLNLHHMHMRTADDVYELFRLLGYAVTLPPYAFEGAALYDLELDEADAANVQRAYIVATQDTHTVYLFEVADLRGARLRSLAWYVLQRGSGLLIVTNVYHEVVFVDPRLTGTAIKSNVRVNKLKLITDDPTRHDLDTLNAIHAHGRAGHQVYQAQADAFNITSITRRFYDEYRRHYERARDVIQRSNPGVADLYEPDKLHAFTQRLLGRLMFLYFLQRKGWLGGHRRFMTEQYRATFQRHRDDEADSNAAPAETYHYYREVLEPLFFETLNTRRAGHQTQWTGVLIPYLNGGLFDPSRDPAGPLILPDSLFDPNDHDGLLAFFNRYNFTVAEDTPLEQDVAVDPEMLGKVFENLLEERDRGQSGSFYTPRSIVSYMCQEALIGYLETRAAIPADLTRAQFDPDSLERYVPEQAEAVNKALDTLTVLDPSVGSGSFLIGMMGEILRLRRACHEVSGEPITPALIAAWKEQIIRDTLYGVDIKPEAIEIAQLRLWLALVVDQTLDQARPLPNLDYKLMAGDSLIETLDGQPVLDASSELLFAGSDEPNGQTPVQLNFVGSPIQSKMALFDADITVRNERADLDKLRRQFFRATPDERPALREQITRKEREIVHAALTAKADAAMQQIEALGKKSAEADAAMQQIAVRSKKSAAQSGRLSRPDEKKLVAASTRLAHVTALQDRLRDLRQPLPFFLYRLHFHEVFGAKGGFDVVVANPPYVRQEAIKSLKPELEKTYPEVYAGTADLYVYFYARALRLLNEGGIMAFITPNKFTRAKYGDLLRTHLAALDVRELVDFGELPVFTTAATFPFIVITRKAASQHRTRFTQFREWREGDSIPAVIGRDGQWLPENALNGSHWTLAGTGQADLLTKIKAAGQPLGTYLNGELYYGIKTGFNKAFKINGIERAALIALDPRSAEIIKPFAVGDDVRKWQIRRQDSYLIFTRRGINIDDYPAIKAHLSRWQDELTPKITGQEEKGRKPGRYKWYEIQDDVAYYAEFEKPKIVYPVIAKESRFAIDQTGSYTNDKTFIIPSNDPYLLGILNSKVVWAFLKSICSALGDPENGGRLELRAIHVSQTPIPDAPDPLRAQIGEVAQKCLAAASDSVMLAGLETKLNALVYRAYGLDERDIRMIEGGVEVSMNQGIQAQQETDNS